MRQAKNKIPYHPYQERQREWPDDARQPPVHELEWCQIQQNLNVLKDEEENFTNRQSLFPFSAEEFY